MEDYVKYFFLPVFLLVVSCSGVSKRDCSKLDWFAQGKSDGELGHRKSLYVQHAAKCLKSPDRPSYLKGREQGLKLFCTDKGLYNRGLDGGVYLGECSKLSQKLKDAYELGRDTYREQEEIKEFQYKITELKDKQKFSTAVDDYDERSVINDDIRIFEVRIKENYSRIKELRIKAYKRKYVVKEN